MFQFQITKSLEQQIQGHVLEVLKLREELASVQKDAERYRWLRREQEHDDLGSFCFNNGRIFDSCIDAAIEGTKP
jgi:hypothetical protein